MTERPPLHPLTDNSAHPFWQPPRGTRCFQNKRAFVIGDLALCHPLANLAIGANYRHRLQRLTYHSIDEHLARDPQTKPRLTVKRAIHIERDETDAGPVESSSGAMRNHWMPM